METIDKDKLIFGTKLKIFDNETQKDVIVSISYIRLNVIFFTYDEFPNRIESWLPTGSHIVETAEIILPDITKEKIEFFVNKSLGNYSYYCIISIFDSKETIILSVNDANFAKEKALSILKSRYNLDYSNNEITFKCV